MKQGLWWLFDCSAEDIREWDLAEEERYRQEITEISSQQSEMRAERNRFIADWDARYQMLDEDADWLREVEHRRKMILARAEKRSRE